MLKGIFSLAGALLGTAALRDMTKKAAYREKETDRRAMILTLRKDGHDYEQIAVTLNKAGFKGPDGETLTEIDVREEHAEIILQEKEG